MKPAQMGAAVASFMLATLAAGCSSMNHENHADCLVTHKEILYQTTDGNSKRIKRLSTSCGTFNVSDSLAGGFNSYDTWEGLQEGKRYDIETGGFRIGLFDTFPIVTKVTQK